MVGGRRIMINVGRMTLRTKARLLYRVNLKQFHFTSSAMFDQF